MKLNEQNRDHGDRKYLYISLSCHALALLVFIIGFDFAEPMAVVENTNQHDIISAVVLGDTAKSKIIRDKQVTLPPPPPMVAKEEPKPLPAPIQKIEPQPDKDIIALQAAKKLADVQALADKMLEEKKLVDKKLADKKLADQKKLKDQMEKNLLSDIMSESKTQQKNKQKELDAKFQKKLQEQAEKSLRQQLLNEEIKLKGTEAHYSQGVVDKYKALIVQAISEQWIVPTQADKTLSSVLLIRVAPGGMVLDVQVTKSSGDPSLDSSARAAVMKASPLPVPPDSDAFEPFRQFVLKVKPENIMDGNISAG